VLVDVTFMRMVEVTVVKIIRVILVRRATMPAAIAMGVLMWVVRSVRSHGLESPNLQLRIKFAIFSRLTISQKGMGVQPRLRRTTLCFGA
jgi:hypothetical protein